MATRQSGLSKAQIKETIRQANEICDWVPSNWYRPIILEICVKNPPINEGFDHPQARFGRLLPGIYITSLQNDSLRDKPHMRFRLSSHLNPNEVHDKAIYLEI